MKLFSMNLLIKISTNENDEYIIKQKISTNEIIKNREE